MLAKNPSLFRRQMMRVALLGALGLALFAGRSLHAEDLSKVQVLMYASCLEQNFFMTEGAALTDACGCYAAEATPFLSKESRQAITTGVPYAGPKPLPDVMLGIVLMARCPATTPLVERMWCGPNRENPDGCMTFRNIRNGVFGGPEPWPAAPDRGSPKVVVELTKSCLSDGSTSSLPDLPENCACFARETAPFHVQEFHDAINAGRAFQGREAIDDVTRIAVMSRRCPQAEAMERTHYCNPPSGSSETCAFYETMKDFVTRIPPAQ